jgi:aminoglycoside phosphotransferase (APT) family kinase protein
MEWDHLAEEQSRKLFAGWLKILLRASPALPLKLAQQHHSKARAAEASDFTTGSYNMCCTVTFEDGFKALVRFPILGRSRFRREKTNNELLVMGFLARFTQVPVPVVLGTGMWECGPYIVTTVVEGTLLSKCVGDPAMESTGNLNISDSELKRAYSGMAHVMLELSKPTFPIIGALGWESGRWKVHRRPLSLNMNELVRVGNYPLDKFAEHSFRTASEYFQELATQQFLHLKYQRNDATKGEYDCQKKYIARCLFQKITQQLSTERGPFCLYCDDFRPSNVLVSKTDLRVTGVIDWEFTYVAPAEFTYTAPWWLLFESPEAWGSDLNNFLKQYKPRLQLFLEILRDCEDMQIQKGTLRESQRLSGKMEHSMENGLFWFCLAARKSFMFDDIYWSFLHEKYFGDVSSLDEMVSLLTRDEQDGLAEFVHRKMQEDKEKALDEHLTFDEVFEL